MFNHTNIGVKSNTVIELFYFRGKNKVNLTTTNTKTDVTDPPGTFRSDTHLPAHLMDNATYVVRETVIKCVSYRNEIRESINQTNNKALEFLRIEER